MNGNVIFLENSDIVSNIKQVCDNRNDYFYNGMFIEPFYVRTTFKDNHSDAYITFITFKVNKSNALMWRSFTAWPTYISYK